MLLARPGAALVALALALGAVAACSPERREGTSAASGGARTSTAPVQSGAAPVGSGARTRRSGSPAPGADPYAGGNESDVTPVNGGGAAAGSDRPTQAAPSEGGAREENVPVGPQAAGSSRAHRERIVEEAAEEDRPSGRSEARFEADGASYRAGVGFIPRYRLRTIERADGPAPGEGVLEKAIPGSKLELPPPGKPAAPVVQKAAEPVDSEPHPVKPRPVD